MSHRLRQLSTQIDVFDDWFAAGELADDAWRDYEKARGHTYVEALDGYAANHVFSFDRRHLLEADVGVLVMPAGRSGHLELGYMAGLGKKTYIVLDPDVERWDVMYRFVDKVFEDFEGLEECVRTSVA